MMSNLFVQIGYSKNVEVDEGLIRHMILNSIRSYRTKFKNEFGELVICCDDYKYWRKDVFPYYKANRKKDRDASTLDWNAIFQALNAIREELKTYFPYKVIQVSGAEADDIIGVLAKLTGEPILILSGDKDYIQLHNSNVKQYDPVHKKWVKHADPDSYLIEHIIRGDTGDGIPNILSPDDCLVTKSRQKAITQKKIDRWMAKGLDREMFTLEQERNYNRNRQLVDFSEIPESIRQKILDEYLECEHGSRKKLFDYFVKYRLKNLLSSIGDF